MSTLSKEEHQILDALYNRQYKTEGLPWYIRSTEEWMERGATKKLHTWKCNLCKEIIHKDNTLMGSGSILKEHGLKHLNEHNLLLFI